MRVLLWSELYWPHVGGAEVFLADLAAAMTTRGHQLAVVTSHHDRPLPDRDVHRGVPIRRVPFRDAIAAGDMRRFLPMVEQAATIIRDFSPDVIHLNAVGPSALFLLQASRRSRAPLLVTLQQQVLASQEPGEGTLLDRVLARADWIVGCSQAVTTQVAFVRPAVAARTSCISNGVELPSLPPVLPSGPPRLLCLGRLVPAKGLDVALRAFATICASRPAVRLTVAGDGASRGELEALARDLGIADRVDFTGWIEPADVPALLNSSTAVVMPSRREGLPLVAIQAASMARPIVATGVGGLPEVVADGQTGFILPADDVDGFADAMARLVDAPDEAVSMGRRGRAHVLSRFDWNRTVDAYDALYSSLTRTVADAAAH